MSQTIVRENGFVLPFSLAWWRKPNEDKCECCVMSDGVNDRYSDTGMRFVSDRIHSGTALWLIDICLLQPDNSHYAALELSKTLFMPFWINLLVLCRVILFEMYLWELFVRFCVCHKVNISSDIICREISQFAILLPAKCRNSTTEWEPT